MKDSMVGWVRSSATEGAVVKRRARTQVNETNRRAICGSKAFGVRPDPDRGRGREGGRGAGIWSAGCLMAGPGVGFEDLIEGGMRDDLVLVHRAADGFGDLQNVDAAVDEGFNGNFIRGV